MLAYPDSPAGELRIFFNINQASLFLETLCLKINDNASIT